MLRRIGKLVIDFCAVGFFSVFGAPIISGVISFPIAVVALVSDSHDLLVVTAWVTLVAWCALVLGTSVHFCSEDVAAAIEHGSGKVSRLTQERLFVGASIEPCGLLVLALALLPGIIWAVFLILLVRDTAGGLLGLQG